MHAVQQMSMKGLLLRACSILPKSFFGLVQVVGMVQDINQSHVKFFFFCSFYVHHQTASKFDIFKRRTELFPAQIIAMIHFQTINYIYK